MKNAFKGLRIFTENGKNITPKIKFKDKKITLENSEPRRQGEELSEVVSSARVSRG